MSFLTTFNQLKDKKKKPEQVVPYANPAIPKPQSVPVTNTTIKPSQPSQGVGRLGITQQFTGTVIPKAIQNFKDISKPRDPGDPMSVPALSLDPTAAGRAAGKAVTKIVESPATKGIIRTLLSKIKAKVSPSAVPEPVSPVRNFEPNQAATPSTPTVPNTAKPEPIATAPSPSTVDAPRMATPLQQMDSPPRTPRLPEVQQATPTQPSKIQSFKDNISKQFTNLAEYAQDTDVRVRQLVNRPDVKVDDVTDVYQKMTLYHGKIDDTIRRAKEDVSDLVEETVTLAGSARRSSQEVRTELNRYLLAKHAPERNAALGDGAAGISTKEAQDILAQSTPEIQKLADRAFDLNKRTLDLLKDSGVITDDLYDTLRNKYPNHVPLQRIMDQADDVGSVLSGRGFDVKSTGIKRAEGSEREVADILTNIVTNYEQAALRAEKNIVDNATLAFARENAEALKNIMTVQKPKVIGKRSDGTPLFEQSNDPTVLHLYEKGKPIQIKISDEKLAIALRGVGREKLPGLLKIARVFTNLYSQLATRFNPEFALPNKIRDLQETITFLASQKDIGGARAVKASLKDPGSVKDVLDAIRGKDSAGAKLYREMKQLGGTTGGMGLSTRQQVEMDIEKMFKLAESKPRQAADKLIRLVDNWNTIFEDSTRLTVYKTALESGATKERAAFLAKEASINFNRMGKGGPVVNALWMFSNASIQGSTKMMRAMKDPKVATGVGTTMALAIGTVSEFNNTVDNEWRAKVPEWDRMNGLVVMLPTEDDSIRYFVLPVSWGLKPINVMLNAGFDALDKRDVDWKDQLSRVSSSFIDAYNPVGGTDFISAFTPTIGDVPLELARNQSWSGAKIRPDLDPNAPSDIQYFDSLKETTQGRLSIKASETARDVAGILISPADINYVLQQYVGGTGRSIQKTSNAIFGFASDEPVPMDEFPFISRFYRERGADEVGGGTTDALDLKGTLQDQSRDRFMKKDKAETTAALFSKMSDSEREQAWAQLVQTDRTLAEQVIEVVQDQQLGLTYTDRNIKQLGIENGERAKFLYRTLDALPEKKRQEKWQEYVDKKLINETVATQIQYIVQNPDSLNE